MTMQRERLRDLACLALLALAVLAFFWPLLLTQAWIPRGGGDLVSFLWPMYRFAARSLRSGVVPLWNPHLHCGTPFAADNQSGLFYPVNLIAFALLGPPSYGVMEGLVVFHVWLAAVTTYVLIRSLGLRRPAAVLGALAFALSDLFVTHIGNLNLNATAAWMPLALWATRQALNRQSARWAGGAGAILAVAALAGHAQLLLFLGVLLALYWLYHALVTIRRSQRRWGDLGRLLGLGLLIAVVGIGGAALMLVPAWQLAGHTGRGLLPYEEATAFSLPPRALVGLIAPGFYGRGSAGFWGPWQRVEVGYAGVASLVLAAVGIGFLLVRALPHGRGSTPDRVDQGDRPGPPPWAFFAFLIPLAFVLAMGRYTPLYRLLYRFVPTFDQIRAPARLIVVGDLGIAVMAAYGLDRLSDRRGSRPRRRLRPQLLTGLTVIAAGILVVVLGVARPPSVPVPRVQQATRSLAVAGGLLVTTGVLIALMRRRPWVRWLFPLLLAVDLVALGSTVEIEPNDPTAGFFHPEVVGFLKADPSVHRIDGTAPAWQPDAALVHGLYEIGGVYNPLGLAPYQAYGWALGSRDSALYNLLGAKYILASKGSALERDQLERVLSGRAVDVYVNRGAFPRAFFVSRAQVVADHGKAWEAIHADDFDPRQTVILEQADTRPSPPSSSQAANAEVAFVRYGLNRLELTVDSTGSGWLVLTDVYYPGWRATIDGRPTPVLRADYTFRAVSVPAGKHDISMAFAPRTWTIGLALSLITWLGLASALFVNRAASFALPSD